MSPQKPEEWSGLFTQQLNAGNLDAVDVAQLYTDFEGTTVDGSGKTVAIGHKAVEVLRRQRDGAWLLIMGDPNGRAPDPDRAVAGHSER